MPKMAAERRLGALLCLLLFLPGALGAAPAWGRVEQEARPSQWHHAARMADAAGDERPPADATPKRRKYEAGTYKPAGEQPERAAALGSYAMRVLQATA